jgi:hypothetical protein
VRPINTGDSDLVQTLGLFNAADSLGHRPTAQPLREKLTHVIEQRPELLTDEDSHQRIANALHAIEEVAETTGALPLDLLKRCIEIGEGNAGLQATGMIASFASEEALETLLQLHSVVREWFLRERIEFNIEKLAGRLGARIIRDGSTLLRA